MAVDLFSWFTLNFCGFFPRNQWQVWSTAWLVSFCPIAMRFGRAERTAWYPALMNALSNWLGGCFPAMGESLSCPEVEAVSVDLHYRHLTTGLL